MRRDSFIGILVALVIHGGLAGFGEWFKPPAVRAARVEQTKLVQLPMPPLEPDEPEIKDPEDTPRPADSFAPPMQADVPQPIQVDSIVQPIEPPPPDGLKPITDLIDIPQGQLQPGGGSGQIFDPSQLDQRPTATVQGKPLYPFAMRSVGIGGTVTVEFIVEKTGAVRDAFAVASTEREFEAEAVKAVMKWKFKPGIRQGAPVTTRMRVDIVFSLNDN
jgi:protein TonB